MSGGSMQYVYARLDDAEFSENTPERRAFAKHLKLVAKALHDIEWVDSSDYRPGDENKAILECVGPIAVLEAHLEMLDEDIQAFKQLTSDEENK